MEEMVVRVALPVRVVRVTLGVRVALVALVAQRSPLIRTLG
jgi:hypothetical protein